MTRDDGLVPGPQDPVLHTPPRRPGSVRRTTTIDQHRGEPAEPQRVVARGRDLLTRPDGTTEVVDQAGFDAVVGPGGPHGPVGELVADPPVAGLDALVGQSASKGLRSRLDGLLPDHRDRATVLHQLLDELPMAGLISSYGTSREAVGFTLPPDAQDRLTDLCSGWVRGGTMLQTLADTGLFPIPLGPPAPDLGAEDGDPMACHDLPPVPPRSIRRRRRLDLAPGPTPEAPLELEVYFRDTHFDHDGVEDVLHEYTVRATLEPGTLVVLACAPTAHTLPWPECPGALGSADRVVGQPVDKLRNLIAVKFTGTSTCTHLNDTLRSMAGATALAAALDGVVFAR